MAKPRSKKLEPRRRAASTSDAETIVQHALSDNPEVRLVLEVTTRARELASIEQPISMDAPGCYTATASISQVPFR